MKIRRGHVLLLVAVMMFVLSGCASNSNSKDNNQPNEASPTNNELQSELKFPISQQIPTLDPILSIGASSATVGHTIFEGLFANNSSYTPVPMLAESYDLSEDGLVYTFHLRTGVKFHNGKEMKAEDVVASLNRWKSTVPQAKLSVGDAEISGKDDYTVVMTLKEPRNDVIAQLANVFSFAAITPKETAEAADANGITEYIGTGPYKFVEWKQNQYVHVAKFDDYKPVDLPAEGFSGKKEAFFKDIYFTISTDSATRFASFVAGEFPYVDVNIDNMEQAKSIPGVTIKNSISYDYNLVFNKKSPLFSNLKYREAVATAIDVEKVLLGIVSSKDLYTLNSSYMLKDNTTWHSDAGSEKYNQKDPAKAKQLLEEAGYNGQEVTLITTKDLGGLFYNFAVMVQSELEQIGMKVKLDITDYATMITKRNNPDAWDMYPGLFFVPATPAQVLYLGPTYGWADDATLQDLLKKASSAVKDEEIQKANDELQKYAWEYLAVVKMGDTYSNYAVRDKFEGFTVSETVPNLSNAKLLK